MKNMTGKWKQCKAENLEVLLKKMGVGKLHREIISKVIPSLEIYQDGDHFIIRTVTKFRDVELNFTVGECFIDTTLSGENRKAVARWEHGGQRLVVTEFDDKDGKQQTQRELASENELLVTLLYRGVTAKRYFTRVKQH
ncbi:cellular retinoic acid-binding protein 2-like [Saccoglossus kowalevskii]|uniref:Cellular retinoic acid-binding protein 2-like n=1 Tax=Saccoglossus kowalevskii TaxID=10224 RepID=A0ABM0MJP9_SACKO|nr:PREDICTED: cellular retinoic acid-binding protein 2-like [Saccoglossus kowalevskii]